MSPKGKANTALAASLLFLFFSSCSAYLAFSRLNTSRAWMSHTRDVQSALAQITITSARAGRLRTEFAESGDLSLLPRYADSAAKLRMALAAVVRLTSDNSLQQANCARIEQLIDRRISLMDNSIDLKRSGKSTLTAQNQITQQIVTTSDELDQLLQRMDDAEQELLAQREQTERASSAFASEVLVASLLMTLILFLIHHRLLTSQVRARSEAEAAQRALSARVLHMQDQERRKFARELHDSVGQNLSAVKMALNLLESKFPDEKSLRDCLKLLDESLAEVRSISYLLHPPMLDEAGLTSAVRWLVEGYMQRSGLHLELEIQEGTRRLTEHLELVLFRVLQESLTNVHRHSGATSAEIKLNSAGKNVILQVKDNGHGIPGELLASLQETGAGGGVGLAGMAERVREVEGRLEIKSSTEGTEISAIIPVQQRKNSHEVAPLTVQEITG